MKLLATGDWHLTEREQDEYRWAIFPWLIKAVSVHDAQGVVFLGDLTDFKDHHSAKLVNRIVDNMRELAEHAPVYGIMGNHDYVDPGSPFFRFIHDAGRGIEFYTHPVATKLGKSKVLFMPHMRRWKAWRRSVKSGFDYIFCHQTFGGTLSEMGHQLRGFPLKLVRPARVGGAAVVSGDVHMPQQVGNLIYAGAPHPIRFGDDFKPRVLLLENGKVKSLDRHVMKKTIVYAQDIPELIHAIDQRGLAEGDALRVVLRLPRAEFATWNQHTTAVAKVCGKRGLVLAGVKVEAADAPADKVDEDAAEMVNPLAVVTRWGKLNGVKKPVRVTGRRILSKVIEQRKT